MIWVGPATSVKILSNGIEFLWFPLFVFWIGSWCWGGLDLKNKGQVILALEKESVLRKEDLK